MNPRRTGQGFSPKPPEDPQGHAVRLGNALEETLSKPDTEPGFDPRRCLKLQVDRIDPSQLEAIEGMELVSQEGKTLVVLFASEGGLREFKHRLTILARGGQPTRRDLLFAIKGVSTWEPSDRRGAALRIEGPPTAAVFSVDVELWPFERRGPERERMREAFKAWCAKAQAKVLDELNQDTVVMYRVQLGRAQLDRLLQHRDVRLVDLPPRFQLPESELMTPLAELEPISTPPDTAPRLAVLDSGLASPLPEDFLGPSRRARGITIALAHTPLIRTTRFDCRGSQMSFRLAAGKDLNEVSRVFQKAKKEDRAELIDEFRKPSVGSQVRNKGTVQAATYEVAQLDRKSRSKKLFVVVTRQVPAWAQGLAPDEPYALVVILEDRSQHEVRYYQQIVQLQLQLRGRARE